eukprot:Clim_evm7s64 gene=Clim_evmTU7s64
MRKISADGSSTESIEVSGGLDYDDALVAARKLRWWHLSAAILMGIEAVVFPVIGIDVNVPTIVSFPADDVERDGPVGIPSQREIFDFNTELWLGLFLALASIDHIINFFLILCKRDWYVLNFIMPGRNPLRWIEYSISASIMAVSIAALVGIYDIHTQFLIGAGQAICMLLGLVVEYLPFRGTGANTGTAPALYVSIRKQGIVLFWVAAFSSGLAWLVIACYFLEDTGVPDFVYAVFIGTAIAFFAFPINFWLYTFRESYNFYRAEVVYIFLSYIAKTYLVVSVFGGIKASEPDD